jgi:Zinc knuckle
MSKYLWIYHKPEHCTTDISTKATMPTPMPPPHNPNITTWQTPQYNRTINAHASKDTCFNCGKMGHFAKDCCSNLSSNINYMDTVDANMQYVPQPSITPQANVANLKAQINVLSMEDNDALIEAMGSSQDFTPA